MSILSKMFGGIFTPKLVKASILGNIPLMPEVKQSRRTQATIIVGPSHLETVLKKVPLMRVDERALERNKYAPWGRGEKSGLPR